MTVVSLLTTTTSNPMQWYLHDSYGTFVLRDILQGSHIHTQFINHVFHFSFSLFWKLRRVATWNSFLLYLFSFFIFFHFFSFFTFLLSLMNSSITKVCTNTYSPNFFYHFGPTRVDKWHMQQVPLSLSLRDTFSILFHSNEFFLLVKMCQYSKPESTCPCATSICTCDLGSP